MKHKTWSDNQLFRRIIHLLMMIFPVIYYWYGQTIASLIGLTTNQILLIVFITTVILEALRLKLKLLIICQRDYELNQLSAFFWSVIGIIMVLYFAPKHGHQNAAFGLPIIWSMSLGDPMIGEIRRLYSTLLAILNTLPILIILWVLCHYWLMTPLWLAFALPPLIILSEIIPLKWIDDNFTMLFVPLLICYCLY